MTKRIAKVSSRSFFKTLLLSTVAFASLSVAAHAADFSKVTTGAEYNWDYKLKQIKASAAYARGLSGRGITIGIFDSGVASNHREFAGRFLGEYDAFAGRWNSAGSPTQGHGTFVAGIAAAGYDNYGAMGVAPGANIRSYKIINSAGSVSVTDGQLAAAIRAANSTNTRILNNSWNGSAPADTYLGAQSGVYKNSLNYYYGNSISAWREASSRGSLMVFAAGNEGTKNPGTFALIPQWFPELKGAWLVSVATDSTGRIASYSNRCGVAADYCLAAPGTSVISTMTNGGYGSGSGTSFSAPATSGGVALLMQLYPYLTGAQVKDILLRTANKTGIYADRSIYGQGLMDLDAATRPVGATSIPTGTNVNGGGTSTGGTSASNSVTFGRSVSKGLADVEIGLLDEYGRSFVVGGDAFVNSGALKNTFSTEDALRDFGVNETTLIENETMKASFHYAPSQDRVMAGDNRDRFATAVESADGYGFGLNVGVSAAYQYGAFADGHVEASDYVGASLIANPYLALAADGNAAYMQVPVAPKATLRMGAFTGVRSDGAALHNTIKAPEEDAPAVNGFVSELRVQPPLADGKLTLRGLTGMVSEQDAVLGSASDGALKMGDSTDTFFAAVGADVKLDKKWTASFDFTAGRSSVEKAAGSLVDTGALYSQAWSAQLTGRDVVKKGDKFGFGVSQPLRVTSGNATITAPGLRDVDGNLSFTSNNVALAADGQETDMQAFYSVVPEKDHTFSIGGVVRLQPNNDSTAKTETIGLARYSFPF